MQFFQNQNKQTMLDVLSFLETIFYEKMNPQAKNQQRYYMKPPLKTSNEKSPQKKDISIKSIKIISNDDDIQIQTQPYFFKKLDQTQKKYKNISKSIDYDHDIQPSLKQDQNNSIKKLKEDLQQLDQYIEQEQEQNYELPKEKYEKIRNSQSAQKSLITNKSKIQNTSIDRSHLFEKKPEKEIIVTEVNQQLVQKVLSWIYSLNLIKQGIQDIDKKLPKICKNGALFYDLINRIEGRGKESVLKGLIPKTKNQSQINANLNKVFSHLRTLEKMNPRYLLAQNLIIDENYHVFWGLLDDMRNYYSNKISPYDTRYKQQPRKQYHKKESSYQVEETQNYQETLKSLEQEKFKIQNFQEKKFTNNKQKSPEQTSLKVSQLHIDIQQTKNLSREKSPLNNSYRQKYQQKKQPDSPRSRTPQKNSFTPLTPQQHEETQKSLDKLQLKVFKNLSLMQNSLQNSLLLSQILQKTHQYSFNETKFNNLDQIKQQFDKIHTFILQKKINIPLQYMNNFFTLIHAPDTLFYAFCYYIFRDRIQNQKKISVYLPYDDQQLDELKLVLKAWLAKLLKINKIPDEWYNGFQDGVLLCKVVEMIIQIEVNPKHAYPKNQIQVNFLWQELANLQTAMEKLRALPMGQKFTWMEHEIQRGNQYAIFGLLEDLYRLYDGLPPRQQPNYFQEGPYFGHQTSYNQQYLVQQEKQQNLYKNIVSSQKKEQKSPVQDQKQEFKKIQSLLLWLSDMGFAEFISNVSWDENSLKEFKDGQNKQFSVFYLKLLNKMNFIDLEFVNTKPKVKANFIQNIRLFIKTIQNEPKLKQINLPIENEILNASRETVLSILLALKQFYDKNLQVRSRNSSLKNSQIKITYIS